jgi:8-oxo-dGTP pyrophosphatase MutT (NUDIX family)
MANDAIPAATLILVRDRAHGPPELLMVTRSRSMAFAPGALVFPGGRIDAFDTALATSLGHDDRGAKVAAIRETIEESGVAAGLDRPVSEDEALALQAGLISGADFASLLFELGLALEDSALTPFARWVPGPEVSRRFDTFFFVAKAPDEDAVPRVGSDECESAQWLCGHEALNQERRGAARLIYPTRKNLERLAQFDSFDAILADARSHPVVPITAWVDPGDDGDVVRIPDGLGYPRTSDPLARIWRG